MTAVEWLINEMDMQYPEINVRRKEWMVEQAKSMEKERTSKLCYGVWRAVKTGANYIYITKDSDLLGYVEPLSEEDRLKIDVELFIAIKPI